MNFIDIFNDPILSFKNFKMGTEIHIAGSFIYDGMKEFDIMHTFHNESEVFSFLYHIAVGVERLQKVLIIMLENISNYNMDSIEESLITHNHQELHSRIKLKCNVTFHARENNFLQVLSEFYKSCRYDRFNFTGKYGAEKTLIKDYIYKFFNRDDLQYDMFTNDIINTFQLKEFFGRIIGSISRKYYNEIRKLAYEQQIYTYELRYESKAAKIFLPDYKKNSLQEKNFNERIALKELIVYLINTKEMTSFMRFLKDIEPLDLDSGLINDYIEDLCNGIISQGLIDTVEDLYQEQDKSWDRIQMVDLIGNRSVMFEDKAIKNCSNLMQSLISDNGNIYKSVKLLINEINILLSDDYDNGILLELVKICEDYIKNYEKGSDNKNLLLISISNLYDQFTEYFGTF